MPIWTLLYHAFNQNPNGHCGAELPLQSCHSHFWRYPPSCMHLNMVVGISKKIIVDNQVSLIIGGILDSHVSDWISADCDCLVALPFNAFMVEFRANYLAKDWEEDTLCKLL